MVAVRFPLPLAARTIDEVSIACSEPLIVTEVKVADGKLVEVQATLQKQIAAIDAEIAAGHGATVVIGEGAGGKGCRVAITFPHG